MPRRVLYIFSFLLLMSSLSRAQEKTIYGNYLLGAVVENGDTIPVVFLKNIDVVARMTSYTARERRRARKRAEAFDRLRYNVYKTYPYAVIAAEILKDVDVRLAEITDKKERKAYMKGLEKELNRRFKGELEDLTISQGQVLVKLINRQTGKNCFAIIRELKGGFSAVVWQSLALLFNNNLKKEYDPKGRDADIEAIVQQLEAYNARRG